MHQHGGDIYNHSNILDFSTNINLCGIPKTVVEAACQGVSLSDRYPDVHCHDLRKAISSEEEIPLEQIICGNGAADLIFMLVLAKKPKKALVPIPSFYEYEQALQIMDCEIVYHELKEEDGFLLQEDFPDKITADVDMVFLCNPNNPTGTLIEPALQERILRRCEACNALLVMDECFMDFTSCQVSHTIKGLTAGSQNLFLLKAFTKLYAMPGLRLGYGLSSNQELLAKMQEVSQPWSVSVPAQMAGIAALKEKAYVEKTLALMKEEKAFLIDALSRMYMKIYSSKANYIFFYRKEELYRKCLEQGVLIRDCSNYRGLGAGYYRVAVRNHEENEKLIEILQRILTEQE